MVRVGVQSVFMADINILNMQGINLLIDYLYVKENKV